MKADWNHLIPLALVLIVWAAVNALVQQVKRHLVFCLLDLNLCQADLTSPFWMIILNKQSIVCATAAETTGKLPECNWWETLWRLEDRKNINLISASSLDKHFILSLECVRGAMGTAVLLNMRICSWLWSCLYDETQRNSLIVVFFCSKVIGLPPAAYGFHSKIRYLPFEKGLGCQEYFVLLVRLLLVTLFAKGWKALA